MKRNEFLKSAFDKFNSGKISADAYDVLLMNQDAFVDEEDEREDGLQAEADGRFADLKEKHFAEHAYERYKWSWCEQHGVKPEDVDEEVGVYGVCYVSFGEFLDNEYQDREYMKHLLSDYEFEIWELYSQKENIEKAFDGFERYVVRFDKDGQNMDGYFVSKEEARKYALDNLSDGPVLYEIDDDGIEQPVEYFEEDEVGKVPLEEIIKVASESRENEKFEANEVKRNVGER